MRSRNVKGMFKKKAQIILFGTTTAASNTSSDMCATESEPSTTNIEDTCPTKTVAPMFGHPAPLSVNSVKTADAVCLTGHKTHSTAITGTKAKTCRRAKIPSARGRCFAAKMLNKARTTTEAMVSKVTCHRSVTKASLLMTMSAWTIPPTRKQSMVTMLCQDIVDNHPSLRQ